MRTAFWSFSIGIWTIVVGALIAVVSVWLAVRLVRRNRHARGALALELLRLLVVALLLFSLARPEFVRLARQLERPLVAVLTDGSGSMATVDVLAGRKVPTARSDWLASQVTNSFWQSLEQAYGVAVDDFAVPPADPEANPGTDLNAALEEALQKHRQLRAIMLLSDGDWNEGQSPVTAATKLKLAGVPVYPVVVGSEEFLPDLELQSVSAPAYGLMDEHVSIPFTIQSRLPREVKTTVSLVGPRGTEATKDIVIPPMAQLQSTILLVPKAEGSATFKVRLPVEKDEILDNNNEKSFTMALRREILKVLVVDSLPRWEFRYLRNALVRDPGVIAECVLLRPELGPARGSNYLPRFPESREVLSEYDVVFLGDVGLGGEELPEESAALLKGLVQQQGSGLVFLPGARGRVVTSLDSELEELMPVTLDTENPKGFGINIESHLALTTRGQDHLLTMLAPSAAENVMVWRSLPGFFWHAPVLRAKPGSEVLSVHATARNKFGRIPLLVTRTYGNGKVLFMGTDAAWRWRRGVEDTFHYRFWGQVVRWMSHQRHLAHDEGIRFFYSPESPVRDHRVFLHATVFDSAGLPLEEGTVRVDVEDESGHMTSIPLRPSEGGWGVFTGTFVPRRGGKHTVTVACEETGRTVSAEMLVDSPRREVVGRPARANVLREIAGITDGNCYAADELAEAVKAIRLLPEPAPRETRLRLWCHPLWGALLVGLLCVYWIGRKLQGRI